MIYHVLANGETVHHSAWQEPGRMLTEAKITQEINKAGSFAFSMPPDHDEIYSVELLKSTVDVLEDGVPVFSGRPVSVNGDFYKHRKIVCEGNLNYLKDIPDLFTSPAEISRIYKLGDQDEPLTVTLTETEDSGKYHASISSLWTKKLTPSENGVSCYVSINADSYNVPVEVQSVYAGTVVERRPWIGSYKFIDKNYSDPKSGGSSAPFYISNNDFYIDGESGAGTMTVTLSVYKRKPLTFVQMFALLFGSGGYNTLADDSRKLYQGACDVPGEAIYDAKFGGSCLDTLHDWQELAGGYIYTLYDTVNERWTINYTVSAGPYNAAPVEFGLNLLDLSRSADVGDTFTVLRPVGKDGDTDVSFTLAGAEVTEEEGYPLSPAGMIASTAAVGTFGTIIRSKEYTVEHDDDADVMAQALYDAAQAELAAETENTAETINISALDPRFIGELTGFTRVGMTFRVYSEPHNLNYYYVLSKKETDLISPEKGKLIFGVVQKLLTTKVG